MRAVRNHRRSFATSASSRRRKTDPGVRTGTWKTMYHEGHKTSKPKVCTFRRSMWTVCYVEDAVVDVALTTSRNRRRHALVDVGLGTEQQPATDSKTEQQPATAATASNRWCGSALHKGAELAEPGRNVRTRGRAGRVWLQQRGRPQATKRPAGTAHEGDPTYPPVRSVNPGHPGQASASLAC